MGSLNQPSKHPHLGSHPPIRLPAPSMAGRSREQIAALETEAERPFVGPVAAFAGPSRSSRSLMRRSTFAVTGAAYDATQGAAAAVQLWGGRAAGRLAPVRKLELAHRR